MLLLAAYISVDISFDIAAVNIAVDIAARRGHVILTNSVRFPRIYSHVMVAFLL